MGILIEQIIYIYRHFIEKNTRAYVVLVNIKLTDHR